MATFDQLSPEQRADRRARAAAGEELWQLAEMLDLPEARVRELAREALVELAPLSGRGVEEDWRGQLADYVLGPAERPRGTATRGHLRRSEAARSWARSLLDSLEQLYENGSVPAIPEGERGGRSRRARRARAARARRRARAHRGSGHAPAACSRGGRAAAGALSCWSGRSGCSRAATTTAAAPAATGSTSDRHRRPDRQQRQARGHRDRGRAERQEAAARAGGTGSRRAARRGLLRSGSTTARGREVAGRPGDRSEGQLPGRSAACRPASRTTSTSTSRRQQIAKSAGVKHSERLRPARRDADAEEVDREAGPARRAGQTILQPPA